MLIRAVDPYTRPAGILKQIPGAALGSVLDAELNKNPVRYTDPAEDFRKDSVFTVLGKDALFTMAQIMELPPKLPTLAHFIEPLFNPMILEKHETRRPVGNQPALQSIPLWNKTFVNHMRTFIK
jgi:hypothetical protein